MHPENHHITSHHKIISLQDSLETSTHTQTLDKITKLRDLLALLDPKKIHANLEEALQTIQKLDAILQSKGQKEISSKSSIKKIAVALSAILDSIKFPENQTLQTKILQMLNKIENNYGRYLKSKILQKNLEKWQNEAGIDAQQKTARATASERIISAYSTQTTNLDLSSLSLTSLPTMAFQFLPNLTTINLNHNQLHSLAPQTFAGLTSLQNLYLSNNQLTSLAPQTFAGLTSLKKLYLYGNRLTSLAPQTFAGLTSLQELDLGTNLLNSLEPQIFAGLTSLQVLDLSNTQLNSLAQQTFAELTSLQNLHLRNNLLNSLEPQTFAGLTSLQNLYLSYNQLTSLTPESLFINIPSTSHIRLLGNRLNLATAEAITRYNGSIESHPHIEFSIYDSSIIGDSEIIEASLPQMIRLWKGLGPSEEVHPLWTTLIQQRPEQWKHFTTFLTRLHNECPRDNGQIDSRLKTNIATLLNQMEKSFTGDLGQTSTITFIQKCLNVATMSTHTCIDRVKVGYVLLQLESALFACTDEQKGALKNLIDQINKTIDFVGNVADGGILFDTALKIFIDIPPQPEDSELTIANYRQNQFIALNTPAQIFEWIRIGDLVEDILKIVYELPDMSHIHKIDMLYPRCCTIGSNTDYLSAAIAYIRNAQIESAA